MCKQEIVQGVPADAGDLMIQNLFQVCACGQGGYIPAVRGALSIKLHCASPSVQAGYLVEQAYYNNVMRDVIAKSLGEAQAAEADSKPFEYMPPDAVITLFAVI